MGAFLSTLGLFLTSFVKESAKMYLTYGLLWGVGSGMSFFPATIVLGHYFHHRFAMAVSITVSGSGIGGLLSAPFINFLLKNTGWKSAIRMLASCAAVLFFCALSYRRTGTPQGDRREERDDEARKKGHKESYLALLKIKAYIILVIAASLFQFCYTVPYVHIVSNDL
jgi:MCP family monocarboxylic acid transporter-like MFS transporter 10